jgi:hypothetical protein
LHDLRGKDRREDPRPARVDVEEIQGICRINEMRNMNENNRNEMEWSIDGPFKVGFGNGVNFSHFMLYLREEIMKLDDEITTLMSYSHLSITEYRILRNNQRVVNALLRMEDKLETIENLRKILIFYSKDDVKMMVDLIPGK